MQTRTLRINIGDWGNDGHGKTEAMIVTVSGKDVSNEAFSDSYDYTCELMGKDFDTICHEYEDSSIDYDFYKDLLDNGFEASEFYEGPIIHVEPENPLAEEYMEIQAMDLIMFYAGKTIEDFSWKIETFDTLLGGYGSALKSKKGFYSSSFGYGLFY